MSLPGLTNIIWIVRIFSPHERRVLHRLALSETKNIPELQNNILNDDSEFHLFLQDLSINTTEMFRDPLFFNELRKNVIPILRTYPYFKVWHAGCSTGEEVYSMAIMLKEEGLYDRAQIYATDFNSTALSKAKEGIYSSCNMKEYIKNYIKAGGENSFADYYNAKYEYCLLRTQFGY